MSPQTQAILGDEQRWADYLLGYGNGYCDGIDRGRQHAKDEAWSDAVQIVHAMSKRDPWPDRMSQRQRMVDAESEMQRRLEILRGAERAAAEAS